MSESSEADPSLPELSPDIMEQGDGDAIDNIVPTRGYHMLPMVGIGGSAGSIVALQEFFKVVPPECGVAFVVIMHLSPDYESSMASLLGQSTTMRVLQAVDGEKVYPNHVYVIPPGKHLITVDGHLRLTALGAERGKRVAVDMFFRSLADTHGPHAAARVGTRGHRGALGAGRD